MVRISAVGYMDAQTAKPHVSIAAFQNFRSHFIGLTRDKSTLWFAIRRISAKRESETSGEEEECSLVFEPRKNGREL